VNQVEGIRCVRHVAALVLVVACVGCERFSETASLPSGVTAKPSGPALVNERWRIVKMAMAHDIFTIEVEVVEASNALAVARELVEPLQSQYAEILVYVYADGEGAGGHVPLKRIEWTIADGFSELEY
jgi:hypothetical protein